jgi:hypothetical protein
MVRLVLKIVNQCSNSLELSRKCKRGSLCIRDEPMSWEVDLVNLRGQFVDEIVSLHG